MKRFAPGGCILGDHGRPNRSADSALTVALYELAFEGAIEPLKHIDPVCRMQVGPESTGAQLEHQGTTLYFCSTTCAERFAQSPDTYLSALLGGPTR